MSMSRSYGARTPSTTEVFLIAASIISALIALVIFKHFVNFFIDICVMGESLDRALSNTLPPAFPTNSTHHDETRTAVEIQEDHIEESYPQDFMLPSRILTADDVELFRSSATDVDSSKEIPDTVACSICLQELGLGQEIVHLNCDHWFHAECLKQWVVRRIAGCSMCPNCRKEIIAPLPIEDA